MKLNQYLFFILGVLSLAVFIVNFYTPVGVSGGVIYILWVITSYWREKRATLIAGWISTIMIVIGFIDSMSTRYIELAAVNHMLAVVVVWISVGFINRYRAYISSVKKNYQMLFQMTNDEILVFLIDKNHRPLPFLEVNDSATQLLGYTYDEFLEKTVYDIFLDTEQFERHIQNTVKGEKVLFESYQKTKNGEIIPVEISMKAFQYYDQFAIICAGRDLSERRNLEEEILEVGEIERQRIGRDLHDDVGQLLSAAVLSAQLLGKEMKSKGIEVSEKAEDIAELVKTAAEHSRNISHGLVPLNVESHGLNCALEDLVHKISTAKDIEIQYSGEEINAKNTTNAIQVYRIAQEAISNAIKHGEATLIDIRLKEEGNFIVLSIKDNGRGFNVEDNGSEGIGLKTMHFRTNLIGGDFTIKSKINDGTEIFCRFPKVNF